MEFKGIVVHQDVEYAYVVNLDRDGDVDDMTVTVAGVEINPEDVDTSTYVGGTITTEKTIWDDVLDAADEQYADMDYDEDEDEDEDEEEDDDA